MKVFQQDPHVDLQVSVIPVTFKHRHAVALLATQSQPRVINLLFQGKRNLLAPSMQDEQVPHVLGHIELTPPRLHLFLVSLLATHTHPLEIFFAFLVNLKRKGVSAQSDDESVDFFKIAAIGSTVGDVCIDTQHSEY